MKYLLAVCAIAIVLGLIGNAASLHYQGWFGGNIGKKHMEELGVEEEEEDIHE